MLANRHIQFLATDPSPNELESDESELEHETDPKHPKLLQPKQFPTRCAVPSVQQLSPNESKLKLPISKATD